MLKKTYSVKYLFLVKKGWVLALSMVVLSGCSTPILKSASDSADRIAKTAIGRTLGGSPLTASVARELNMFAKTAIGQLLAEADRQRAQEAAQRAIEQREAAAKQAAAARDAKVEQQLRAELAKARNEAERERAEKRAAEAREAALRNAMAQTQGPSVEWAGEDGGVTGSAQALGPTQVAGQKGCEKVREIAIIQGKEVRQEATFCLDPQTGGRVRV